MTSLWIFAMDVRCGCALWVSPAGYLLGSGLAVDLADGGRIEILRVDSSRDEGQVPDSTRTRFRTEGLPWLAAPTRPQPG